MAGEGDGGFGATGEVEKHCPHGRRQHQAGGLPGVQRLGQVRERAEFGQQEGRGHGHQGVVPAFAATGAAAAHLVKDGEARVGFAAFGGTGGPLGGNDPLQAVGVAVNFG